MFERMDIKKPEFAKLDDVVNRAPFVVLIGQ